MKKILIIILIVMLTTGCSAQEPEAAKPHGYSFLDDLGRTVTLDKPRRAASLLGSFSDIWYLSGNTLCAASADAWEDFDLPLPEDAVDLGSTKRLSLESLLAAEPDFVLASVNTPQHVQWMETMEKAGITVAYFDVKDFEDYLRVLKICCEINENPEAYDKYGEAQRERIEAAVARHEGGSGEKVLVLRASAASIRAKNSDGTVLGTMLRDFGCVNIADSDESLLENLGLESIAKLQPDTIFVVQTADDMDSVKSAVESMFKENPLWRELDAVKNGQVYYMEKMLYNMKPNANWAEAYEKLEAILFEN